MKTRRGTTAANTSGRWICATVFGTALFCCARPARATNEIAALDGHYLGQAGTGIASSGGAVSLFHNPALIGATTGKGDFLFSPSLSYTHNSAPVAGPNQQQSNNAVSPAGFIAATYHLSPQLAIGAAFQPTGGSGGKYEVNGSEISAAAFALEADLAAAYAVTDRLSLGVMYRVGYLASTSKSPDASVPGATTKVSLSGADLFAFTAGAAYRFGDDDNATKVGFYFRSRISADITGTTETAGGKIDTTSHYSLPDKFQLGVSHTFLERRLLLAAQGGLAMYGWLPASTTTTLQLPTGPVTVVTTSADRTVWEGKVGGEYWAVPETFALRAGVWFGPEQTRDERVSIFNSMLGFFVKPTIGAGVRLGKVDLDLGLLLGIPHGKTVASTTNGNAGEYSGSVFSAALGFNYRFD